MNDIWQILVDVKEGRLSVLAGEGQIRTWGNKQRALELKKWQGDAIGGGKAGIVMPHHEVQQRIKELTSPFDHWQSSDGSTNLQLKSERVDEQVITAAKKSPDTTKEPEENAKI